MNLEKMKVNIGQRVKTNKKHDDLYPDDDAFEGKIVGESHGDNVYVLLDCGCIKNISITWLKKADSNCNH